MKFSRILLILSLFFPVSIFAVWEGSRIDLWVSPIRHEFRTDAWSTVTKSIKFFNNADIPYNISLSSEDCEAAVDYGTPKCMPFSGSADPLHISTWIRFQWSTNFIVPPKSSKDIEFTVQTPTNASPGGHYAAIFFNNPDSPSSPNTVKVNRRIGTLLLVTVNGDIVYNASLGNVSYTGPGGNTNNSSSSPTWGIQPIWTFDSLSKIFQKQSDWSAILEKSKEVIPGIIQQWKEELNPFWSAPELPKQSFLFEFSIPLSNSGTTHVKPTGRVEIKDEDGNTLKSIGKESIKTPEGVYIGEKIVDYLPINDEDGNVLPWTSRIYKVDWQWFAYQWIENGKSVIKFQTPSDFYSQNVVSGNWFLWPWERLKLVKNQKTFHIEVSLEYLWMQNRVVPITQNKDIIIEYLTIEKGINYGIVLCLLLLSFLFWILLRKRDRTIHILETEVDTLEDEVHEFEKAKILAKQAIAQKALKKKETSSSTEKIIPPVKKTRTKKVETPASLETIPVKPKTTRKKATPPQTPPNE